jgi:outer membrane protein assembly factor BamB
VFSDAVAGDGIVVVCGTGGLFAVNAADGSTRFSNSAFPCTADATIANGVIYEPQAGDVAMFDEFGDALGRLGSGAAVGPPAVVDGSVYAAESISGVDKWSIPTPASTAQAGTRGHARPNVRHLHPNRALKPYRPHRAR